MDDPSPNITPDTRIAKNKPAGAQVNREYQSNLLRSFTRLIVGGILVSYDSLTQQVRDWEKQIPQEHIVTPEPFAEHEAAAPTAQAEIETRSNQVATSRAANSRIANKQVASDQDHVKYALIGAAFEIQERLGKSLKTADRATSFIGRLTGYAWQPFSRSRLFSPLRDRFETLVERGEKEVNVWIETGRAEEAGSRELANTAIYDSVDGWVNYFAQNPEVQELVQTQSIGLAEEVVEEVRERTVSADNFVEGIVRAVLRRPSRSQLPYPPEELRLRAIPTHSPSKPPAH